ncbi:hypothetical protein L1987_67862 [Smallanthus sonchifolius]|uniref:Uncharacterized protein n=1 Tax=Smallanthus sonchifolius TaxID=185202 RepID=A0ACB9B7U4_9ASTR|nr:hypothetical protein L1987_67862 [Smallanthus sonchifolius]
MESMDLVLPPLLQTARVLVMRGVRVVMAVRDIEKGITVREAIITETPDAKVDIMELDLSSLASVGNFATKYRSSGLPLNILIYNPMYAYGLSKLANILHAKELARLICNAILKYFVNDASQGAATTCYLALNPKVKGVTGEYFSDSNLAEPSTRCEDQELAKELWGFSLGLTSTK